METVKEIKAELNRPRKPKKNILMKQQSLVMNNRLFIFVIPALLIFAIFWIWPFLKLFTFSVTDFNGFNMNYNNVGFNNFKSIIESGTLTNSIKNTLIYTVLLVIVGNILALILAMALNTKIKGMGFYRSAAYIPALFSAIVIGFIWSYVYMPQSGMIPSVMNLIGIDASTFNILGDYQNALYGITVVDIWKNIGQTMIIYLAGLQTIDDSLLESASMDGCNELQLIRYVKIPLLAPAITINIVLSVINGLKAFDYPFIMTNGGPGDSTNTLMFSIYKMAFTEQQFGKAAAFSVVSFIVIIIITALLLVIMNKKESEME
ncbi:MULTISPECIES: carbohydrate ABC transporter permease [Niallia]|jgi:ABC-type sugar transport system permease subunit|uniref:carbohydrate ABC transporter permease n=1 Tax=Niallia TaxID=2837506 RepID=UPI0011AC1389|nr:MULTISPECIES: sugar ABC transporter permease [Niallia]UTI42758.1 sugar ABC transporter permease [Niallia sp. RD1]